MATLSMGFQCSTRTKDDVTIGTEDRLTGMMHVQMMLETVDTKKAFGTLMTKFRRCLLLFHVAPFFERIESIQCRLVEEEEENKNIRLFLGLFNETHLSDRLSMIFNG
jgi:hypothetical protein